MNDGARKVLVEIDLDALADRLAPRVAAAEAHPYYDQRTSPLGKRRFLEAARRLAFPSWKNGRQVCALRVDVDRYLRARPVEARAQPSQPPAPPPAPAPLAAAPAHDPATAARVALLASKGVVLTKLPRR